ncbi:MAG: hypothetical protein JW741_08700 [Sedimentisphaerales bacterium]|nr:hypothetical protein [Sedimentisphaerales bacterium]
MRKGLTAVMLAVLNVAVAWAAGPVEVKLVEVRKIWDGAPHNAFTDLVRWRDSLYCAFREGRGHVSTDGRIRVLKSTDARQWSSAHVARRDGFDLRDAHLSVTPDDRLMLIGGAAPRKTDHESAPTGSFVAFSADGAEWTEPQIVMEPGRWLWCVTWHRGKAYGVSYTAGGGERYLSLHTSTDGLKYETLVPRLFEEGYPNETPLRFDRYGVCYALARRDGSGATPRSALLGISRGDYTQWQWHDLGADFNSFGGPNFIQLPTGYWIAAGRMHAGGAHTAVTLLDVVNHKMTKLLKLPSGGDTSYPGLLWHNDRLWISYYSSHENKTTIYLAELKASYSCPTCGAAMKTVPMLVGLPTETMREQLRQGKALLAGCAGDPHNPVFACVCAKCRKWKTAEMMYWQDLPTEFGTTAP